jgi:hypothetical protein
MSSESKPVDETINGSGEVHPAQVNKDDEGDEEGAADEALQTTGQSEYLI